VLVQQVTPEVLRWISAQAQAGHKPDAVLAALRASGWNERAARSAIERARGGSLDAPPPPIAVPGSDLPASAWVVRTSDREIRVLASMQLPRVVVFGDVLSDEECDLLIELARGRLQRSPTVDNWSGSGEVHSSRTSEGAHFAPGETELVAGIERRIAELVQWPVDRAEGLQVLRYVPGAEYHPHHDYFDPTTPGGAANLKRGGARVGTLLLYLQAAVKGGGTTFADVGFEVAPTKGNAVFFSYDTPHSSTLTLHGGAPVIEGEKWVATKWFRESVFV
jgi:prolyl 4-hydroxylase